MMTGDFAAIAITLYCAHHVGDYWVQTDDQAAHKGLSGEEGRLACLTHVLTYTATQFVFLWILYLVTKVYISVSGLMCALLVSAVTHYIADRREPLRRIASWIPGKIRFWYLGSPRRGNVLVHLDDNPTMERVPVDNPSLGTGAWALDQSWHIFWGVFVAALIAVGV